MLDAIVETLEGHASGDGFLLRCPAHDDHNPSLSIRDDGTGKLLVHCHANCSQESVINALKAMGLWGQSKAVLGHPAPPRRVRNGNKSIAAAIWKGTEPATGTLVEKYLESRGIHIPIPSTIRFHRGLFHPSEQTFPAMVAVVTDVNDIPQAIHRTFLAHDGESKAPVRNNKLMLGPCAGGSVRLAPASGLLAIGEGLETCLSVMQERRLPAWAALSTSGLRSLKLPEHIEHIVIAADGDEAGEAAAVATCSRWQREGCTVSIARPPTGLDFNDMLTGEER